MYVVQERRAIDFGAPEAMKRSVGQLEASVFF